MRLVNEHKVDVPEARELAELVIELGRYFVGEAGIYGALAGEYGVPVVMNDAGIASELGVAVASAAVNGAETLSVSQIVTPSGVLRIIR